MNNRLTGNHIEEMSGGKIAVESLKSKKVKHVFGLIGSATIEMFDALYDEENINFIGVRDERTGTHMADGYARATGQPGVIIAGQNGPGATNLVTGLAQATAAFSPVVSIAGAAPSNAIIDNEFQKLDQQSLFKPVTKKVWTIDNAEQISEIFHEAFCEAITPKCGPVHLNLPRNILSTSTRFHDFQTSQSFTSQKNSFASENEITKAAEIIKNAKRPVIIAGGGIKNNGRYDELLKLAKTLNSPIVTSAGHGDAIPFDNQLNAGQMGPRGNPIATRLTKEADVILALGTRLGFNSTFYSYENINQKASIIQVELDSKAIGNYFPVKLGICADAPTVAQQINNTILKMKKIAEVNDWTNKFIQERTLYLKKRDKEALLLNDNKLIQPSSIFKELRDILPRNAAITLDAGTLCLQATDALNYWKPPCLFTPLDFGLVGFSFACGLGIKVAQPDRPVISLIGDGGFGMTISELSTAIQYGINTVTIVMNNQCWGAEKAYQRDFFEKRFIGSDINSPPFDKVAELYGAKGFNIEKISELKDAVEAGLKCNKPVVINVAVDPAALYSFRRDSFKHRK